MLIAYLLFVLVGIAAGILGGLLGISGGLVTVPSLLLIFHYLDLPKDYVMHLAIGTSLAAMIFNTLSSAWAHHQRGSMIWSLSFRLVPGIIIGSILGAYIADLLSKHYLETIFGICACLLGVIFLLFRKPIDGEFVHPNIATVTGMGFGVATISSILGIGGGVIMVPTLMAIKVKERQAIGIAATTSCLITTIGALSYLYFGLGVLDTSNTVGFIYLPAFIVIGVVSGIAGPFGAKLAYILHPLLLRRIFGLVLIATGVTMILL